jgi:hypothetical protein
VVRSTASRMMKQRNQSEEKEGTTGLPSTAREIVGLRVQGTVLALCASVSTSATYAIARTSVTKASLNTNTLQAEAVSSSTTLRMSELCTELRQRDADLPHTAFPLAVE